MGARFPLPPRNLLLIGAASVLALSLTAVGVYTLTPGPGGSEADVPQADAGLDGTRVDAEPASMPSCPTGQIPVSFSIWGDGATLVCQGSGDEITVMLTVDGRTSTSATAETAPSGYTAGFSNGETVDIGLGGWMVWERQGSRSTVHVATRGWRKGETGASAYPATDADVGTCPTGTHPESLSTWDGGWLLTCGTDAAVTAFRYIDGSARGSGGSMTTQGGRSCGTDSAGRQVCVNASPAVVVFTPQGGTPTQHSVDAGYTTGVGFGGAGQGTGAYGLPDPKHDAASQVAYLNGILQQSKAARSSVKIVVQNILKCASTQDDVRSAQNVAAARTTELEALDSAPVDAVPGGITLVAQLRAALQDSLTADRAYVTAAGQVAGGQCDAGRATYRSQTALIDQTTNEKTAFTDAWNSRISGPYGTPTYTRDDI